jgi:hypothetical protein
MTEEPRKTEVKPSKAERRRRIDITESLLIDCASVTEIRRYFAEKESLHLGRRTVERYAEIAEHRIVKGTEPLRQAEIRKAKRRLERCFARAMSGSKKNVFAAIAAQKAIIGLLALNPPKDDEEDMSVEELARQVVIQRKEMDLYSSGKIGITSEIEGMLDRYRSLGENPAELLQELSLRVEPKTAEGEG